jgi:signal transduction histidine kinase/HAMP domain-containing protein
MSFRAQLVFVLTVLLLLFAGAAGVATLATLDRALQEDGLRDVHGAADARRDALASQLTLNRQRAGALLESIASSCDLSGHINRACAADALGDWARRDHIRYARLTFPRAAALQYGSPLPVDPALYRDAGGLKAVVTAHDTYSGGRLTAVLQGDELEAALTADFRPDSAGSITLFNAQGQPLTSLPAAGAAQDVLAQACRERAEPAAVHSAKQRTLVAASALSSGEGCVVAQLPVGELLQPALRLRNRFAVLAVIFVAFAAGLALLLAYLMARPLHALTRRVETMSRGDFDSVVPRGGPTEIRAFANAFARMARSLKQSHEALQQSEEKLRLSYRAAHLTPWEASLTHGYFRWMDFSVDPPVMREEPLAGVLARVHPEDLDRVQNALSITEHLRPFQLEFRYSKPDGEMIWLASRGECLRRITGPVLIGVNLDVTHRRRVEELERDRERLAAVAHIAAELSHEINNPLAAVAGALYLLKGAVPGSEAHRHCLEIATTATDRITHIARQLLGLYQRTAGAEPVDLVHLVREVLEVYREQAQARRVRLTADLPQEAPLTGHAVELRTAVANVLANSLTSVPPEGRVVVRVRRVHERRLGREGVRITIADNGTGIAAEHLNRVFEAFFSTSEQRGTGLGLWVTSNIIRKHYGSIRVRSSQSGARHGTTVSIFLPSLDADEATRMGAKTRAVA